MTPEVAAFVQDFATWSKREQDKIELRSNSGGFSIGIKKRLLANKKYNGSVGTWIEDHYTTIEAEVAFFLALDYLKKQNKIK